MNTSERPTINVPTGDAPGELQTEDHLIGDGPEAVAGAQINVDYVGVSWSTGQEFDASWNPIQDISALSGMVNLRQLDMTGCPIDDISPLSSLVNMERLYLRQNQIDDIIYLG
ncbi:MAG: hypothetical protein GY773_34460 [Actinomycetia bacterium]|nr:hypothetical protein [Actinomycetes bacterium]